MSYETMNERQVAAYLRMDVRDVMKLASRGQIPCRKVGQGFQFRKGQVDHWVEGHLCSLDKRRLAGIERGVTAHHGVDHVEFRICPLIPPKGLAVPLAARTRGSVLRNMVAMADKAGLVYDRGDLFEEIQKREELCSTALSAEVALPHPRHTLPYDITESFIIVGSAPGGIPFGAADGSLTRLFFLICCKDDRTHLHVLARLARMLHDPQHLSLLIDAQTPEEMWQRLTELEETVVAAGD